MAWSPKDSRLWTLLVLDGYPASKDQADHLAELAAKLNLPRPIVIKLDLPDDVARQRLKQRQRVGDTPELIEERLKDYHREMDMIRSYYPETNIWTVNGDKPVAAVSSTIEAILKDEIPKP
jgi:adenylate kinase family enzyme